MRLTIFISALIVCGVCVVLTDGGNHAVINILLAVAAYIAAGVAAGVHFHHLSNHSIAQKAFHIFTIFVVCRVVIFFTAYYFGGRYNTAAEFMQLAELILATGKLIGRAGLYPVHALGINLFLIVVITLVCYLEEDEIPWTISMFCLWTIILGMALLGFFINPL